MACKDSGDQTRLGLLSLTWAAASANRRGVHTEKGDASPARSARKVRPLQDKVQSGIIKLESERQREADANIKPKEKRPRERGAGSAEWK